MDALRGGALVPHLFRHDPTNVGPEGLPHYRPEVMAACDAIVDERWASRSHECGRLLSVGDLLFEIYDAQAQRPFPDVVMGYVRFRQAQLRLLEGRPQEAVSLAMEALYGEVCGSRIQMDFFADPPRWVATPINPEDKQFFATRWVTTAHDAAKVLGLDPSGLWAAYASANARWSANPLCPPLPLAWSITRHAFDGF